MKTHKEGEMRLFIAALMVLILWHGGAAGLRAQTEDEPYIRVIPAPEVKVYISPPENGTEREAAYFKANFETELMGAGYAMAESREDSDFYMTLSVVRNEDEAGTFSVLNMTLMNTRNGQEIVTITWPYNELPDMDSWNPDIKGEGGKAAKGK
jgi:hypothetical protein